MRTNLNGQDTWTEVCMTIYGIQFKDQKIPLHQKNKQVHPVTFVFYYASQE